MVVPWTLASMADPPGGWTPARRPRRRVGRTWHGKVAPLRLLLLRKLEVDAREQRLDLAACQLGEQAQVRVLPRVDPDVLVTDLLPGLLEIKAAVDRLRGLGQERLEQDRRAAQLLREVVQHFLGLRAI